MNHAACDMWPELPFSEWRETCETLHLWAQIVGKIRLNSTPWINHSWHATLYVTARGLTTSPIPYGSRVFEIEFDFLDHCLVIRTDRADVCTVPLQGQSVASFYEAVFGALAELGIPIQIHGRPNEVVDSIPFAIDRSHASYDADFARRFWRVLVQADRVLKQFRTGFVGKSSPVHLFWGSFDLAVTRFSGRTAPPHPGGIPNLPDRITREAYSREVSSAGFWPGGGPTDYAAFYSYAYPVPAGYVDVPVQPAAAFYQKEAGEFLLPYDAVRTSADPEGMLLDFLESTYDAAATCGNWPRDGLESPMGRPLRPLQYE